MKTFRIGGVHPAENKLSAGKAIETLALPKQAVFPLSQHIGAPATAIVKRGDVVKVGTRLPRLEASFRLLFSLPFQEK